MPRADDPALTAVRGLAAFWVFVYHAWLSVGPQLLVVPLPRAAIDLTPLASAGWAGVGVFYVLSGYLLWSVFDDWVSEWPQGHGGDAWIGRSDGRLGSGRRDRRRRRLRLLAA